MTLLVVGLGNPGPRYERTRHNLGHMTVDVLAARASARWSRHRAGAYVAETRAGMLPGGVPGPRVLLAKSTGYMNLSGAPVAALMRAEGIDIDELLVVHDELDIDLGTLRMKRGGGEGGHNGLKSISQNLGTRDYGRLRLGIGRPPGRMDPADYVLQPFPKAEAEEAALMVQLAADAVGDIATLGWEKTQMDLHTRD
ncbi:peptidyl-tRNA hydrolase [Ruaniaceae bacterium KH17]|nr:peptidyl-tRNA hydrolase [Ruaniaceae bacterium KH17]